MKILQNLRLKNRFTLSNAFFSLGLFCSSLHAQSDKSGKTFADMNVLYNLPFQNCWSHKAEQSISNIAAESASDNDSSIYVTTYNSELIEINSSGKIQWKADLGGQIVSNPFVNGKNIVLVTKSISDKTDGSGKRRSQQISTLRSLNRITGVTNWLIKTFDSEKIYSYGFQDNIILIGEEGTIKCVRMSNGEIVWEGALNSKLSSKPFLNAEQAFVGTLDGHVIQFSLIDGRQISKLKISSTPTAVLVNPENRNLFWGDDKGSVFSVKNADPTKSSKKYKTRWQFRNGARISHLTLTPAGLMVSSYDNFIYLIRQEDGEIIWKKRFAGRIAAEPFIVNGFALVMTLSESYASVIDLNAGKTVNKISLKEENAFTNNPVEIGRQIIFPTLDGVFSFSADGCSGV